MPTIHLFDDNACRRLYPFHLVKGVEGIRHGAFTQRERWARVEQELADRGETGELYVNSRWIPDADTAADLISAGPRRLEHQGTPLTLGTALSNEETSPITAPRAPRMLDHANDLFSGLEDQLARDLDALRSNWALHPAQVELPTQMYGPAHQVLVAGDAVVRAATLDTSGGAIVIGPGARIEPGSHLEGPVVVHEGAVVRTGAHIRGATVIGPHCKVGGEIANVNFQGWANKAHGGFLGNSVIGRWCNLGAGTVSSNLKNTYGFVRQWSHAKGQMEDSGLQFCGVLMGDHSKCGIGTTLNTGTILGPACVVFDAGFPPKHLAPFSWHDARSGKTDLHDLDRMLRTAETVMARRNQTLSAAARDNLSALHAQAAVQGASN